MAAINPQEGQSLFDIALQEYGSFEAVFTLMEDNDFSHFEQEISVYQSLNIVQPPVSQEVYNYYQSRNLKPATAVTGADMELLEAGIVDNSENNDANTIGTCLGQYFQSR